MPPLDETSSPPRTRRYAVALIAVGVASTLRFFMQNVVANEAPFLFFFAAVMASGWYGGMGPGLLATIVSAGVASFFFLGDPPSTFDANTWKMLRISGFMIEGGITSAMCGQLHSARLRAVRAAAEARELERTVERISEAEQRRIGQDLHDGLGQHLTGVAFLSKALTQRLTQDSNAEAADAAATINQYVNESIRWTRDLARGLAPMDLDCGSITESLRDLARKTSRMFAVECTYDGVETVQLQSDEIALNLYRVAQEAVSNAAKHGNAKRITIDLHADSGDLVLTIQDDGIGFDTSTALESGQHPSGMGLLVMKYRTGVIGGKLTITSRKNADGTLVRCRAPLKRVVAGDVSTLRRAPTSVNGSAWRDPPSSGDNVVSAGTAEQ